jgi:hypothetical protein
MQYAARKWESYCLMQRATEMEFFERADTYRSAKEKGEGEGEGEGEGGLGAIVNGLIAPRHEAHYRPSSQNATLAALAHVTADLL